MGSTSDWPTMEHAARTLRDFGVAGRRRSSARTARRTNFSYATAARGRGLKCIIAGAGGAAHLPGMTAAITDLPVLGVPVESKALKGMDSLLSIVQMPAGIPTATFAIGKAGAVNAALFAVAMLANESPELAGKTRRLPPGKPTCRESRAPCPARLTAWRSEPVRIHPPHVWSASSAAANSAACSRWPRAA
jgi:5-(carboxyamino)imidazole ribonucleotide mutase